MWVERSMLILIGTGNGEGEEQEVGIVAVDTVGV